MPLPRRRAVIATVGLCLLAAYACNDSPKAHWSSRSRVLESTGRYKTTREEKLVGLVSRRDVPRGSNDMMPRKSLPLPAEFRGPSLYLSAVDTPRGVIGTRLDD